MATVRLIFYEPLTDRETTQREIHGVTLLDAATEAAVIGMETPYDFHVVEPIGAVLKLYWVGRRRQKVPAAEARARLAAKLERDGLICTNCSGDLPENHGYTDRNGKHKFCDACAGLAEALNIGASKPTFLYDDGKGGAIAWTSGVPPLGVIVHKTVPQARFQPVRYRVRMLDGSMWHGTGPRSNGNYIRLRPMKGA